MLPQLSKPLSQASRLLHKKADYLMVPGHMDGRWSSNGIQLSHCQLEHAIAAKIHAKNLGGVELQKDPVCGMMVDEKKTKLTSKHGDKTFYFCSSSCKTTFDKDSHRYGHQ